jgi:hypothetical protein
VIGIASFGGPGEPGASEGVSPHDVEMMIYYTVSNGSSYVVGYTASPDTYSNYLPDVQQMIDSFQIIESR